jgi:hypothetical protein
LIVSSSATNDVVILTRGNMVIFEAWLNNAMETPAAASSTAPNEINMTKLAPKAIKIHSEHVLLCSKREIVT